MTQLPPDALDAFRLPALIVAIPTGLAVVARAVLWVRQVIQPVAGGNGTRTTERTLALVENQQDDLRRVIGLLEQRQAEVREDRVLVQSQTRHLQVVANTLDRVATQLTAIALNTEQTARDTQDLHHAMRRQDSER